MTRCQRMGRVERRASGDCIGGPGIFPIGGLSGREPSAVTCSRPGRFYANAAGGLSDIRSQDQEAFSPLGTPLAAMISIRKGARMERRGGVPRGQRMG